MERTNLHIPSRHRQVVAHRQSGALKPAAAKISVGLENFAFRGAGL
jgi:hypothetical protein